MDPGFQLFTSLRFDQRLRENAENTRLAGSTPSPFYMLAYHRDRLLQAAQHFQWSAAEEVINGEQGLEVLRQILDDKLKSAPDQPHRVKILLDRTGTLSVEVGPVPLVPLEQLYPQALEPSKSPSEESTSRSQDREQEKKSSQFSSKTGGGLTLGPGTHIISAHASSPKPWDVHVDKERTAKSAQTSYKTTSRDMYDAARKRAGIENMTDPKEVLLVNEQGEVMEGSLTSPHVWRNGKWVTPPVSSGGQIGTTRRWLLEKGLCVERTLLVDELVDGEECLISNGVRGVLRGRIRL